jgi:hypothetical protein
MLVKFTELNPKMQRFLSVYPVRNPVKWIFKNERVVLVYPKNFTNFESWLHKRIGGPDMIRRPLDEVGSKVWLMCDGKHTIEVICNELDEEYHEEIEPVLDRVWRFLELLLKQNLIRISPNRVKPKKLRVMKKN